MSTMTAAVLVEPGRFEIERVPLPAAGPDDVLIKVAYCGICGTDSHIFDGGFMRHRLPLTPGHEFSGTIAAVGSAVSHVGLGQKVVVDINHGCGHCYFCRRNEVMSCPSVEQIGIDRAGGFASHVVVPGRLVIAAPHEADMRLLALTEPVACVVRSARKSGAGFARSVLVLGAGPIGNLHVQMMRLVGAAPIVVADRSPARAALALKAGADAVVSNMGDLDDTVRRMTGGRGVDLAIESVGLKELYAAALGLIRSGGQIAVFGLAHEGDTLSLPLLPAVLREYGLKGSVAGMGEDMHDALTLLTHGRFDVEPFTRAVYPLERIQEAFDTLRDRPGDLKTLIALPDN